MPMKLALYGYGGHAKEVAAQINKPIDFFVDDAYLNKYTRPISSFNPKTHLMMVAVSNSRDRFSMVQRLPANTRFFSFIHPTTLVFSKNIHIGAGSFIGANCILTTDITLGDHALLNRGNQIGHDTNIGDFFSAMPGAIVSGNVTIGNRCFIGNNASINEKLVICDDVIIGSNAAVVKNLSRPGTYVGVPAKKLMKRK
ncbi:MAG: acetyltransferase [Bacteroidota bacterium]|jgi:sugar O-acyltransferase (sialic acid O-acetyltransferase NeuD family)